MNKILTITILVALSYMAGGQPQKDSFKCVFVERMPEAPYDVQQYFATYQRYPENAKKEGAEGRVLVRFIVTEKGTFDSIRVKKGVHPSLDSEAIRVVACMPPWTPGKTGGKPVRVHYTLPVLFRLE